MRALYDAKPATVVRVMVPKDQDTGMHGAYIVRVEEPMRPYALVFRPVDLSATEEQRLAETIGTLVGKRERIEFLFFPAKDAGPRR